MPHCLGDAQRILLDRLGRRCGHEQHGDLATLAGLERRELLLEPGERVCAQGAGRVDDMPRQRRHGLLRRSRQARGSEPGGEPERAPQWTSGHRAHARSVTPNRTCGGRVISASFSTVNVGFVS